MYEYQAKIVDVYDGDTFTFEIDLGFSITVKEKLRLFGINTPEVRGKEKVMGNFVRDYVRKLILGKTVGIKVYKKGKFGRYIADVFPFEYGSPHDMESLTEHLIKKKYGVEYMSGSK